MARKRKLYAVKAYGFPGHPFPSRFYDGEPTLKNARHTAVSLVKEGWRFAEVLHELPLPVGHKFGANWEVVEKFGVE